MSESPFVKIKLPNSNLLAAVMGFVFGAYLLAVVLLTLMGQPSEAADWIGIVLGSALGIGSLLYSARAALQEHALLVYHKAGRIVVRPGNQMLSLDRVESISVWRTTGLTRRFGRRGARPWGVFLMQTDGKEVVVWEGSNQDAAHRVAHEISKEIDRPWIGGSKAR